LEDGYVPTTFFVAIEVAFRAAPIAAFVRPGFIFAMAFLRAFFCSGLNALGICAKRGSIDPIQVFCHNKVDAAARACELRQPTRDNWAVKLIDKGEQGLILNRFAKMPGKTNWFLKPVQQGSCGLIFLVKIDHDDGDQQRLGIDVGRRDGMRPAFIGSGDFSLVVLAPSGQMTRFFLFPAG